MDELNQIFYRKRTRYNNSEYCIRRKYNGLEIKPYCLVYAADNCDGVVRKIDVRDFFYDATVFLRRKEL